METKKKTITFAAIDKFIDRGIVAPTEVQHSGREWVSWGDRNSYPDYLLELYRNVTTLRTVVDGCVDYVCGNGAATSFLGGRMNRRGETADDIVRALALNKFIYGGMALQVLRNRRGEVSEVYVLPVNFVRTNREADVFWYSEEWGRSWRTHSIVYPKFMPGVVLDESHAASVIYSKSLNFQTYPTPAYAAAVKSCEIERHIDDFHLSALENGFMGSYMFNFNNGVPEDEIKEEIERDFSEKFGGTSNAGRVVFSWNRDRNAATTVQKMEIDDYGEKYRTLAAHSRQQIFAAFRANANLFGIPTESNGFNSEEYESAFKLFNRTMIRPVQMQIADIFDRVAGAKGSLTIEPFTLEGVQEEDVK